MINKKIDDAKTEYIISGYLWDENTNSIVKHTEDMEDNNIVAGEPVLIYFRCKGTKCNCAWNFIKRVNDLAKNLNLKPLSDNPTFEQNIINPRRFLVKAAITQSDPIHNRRFNIFDFNPEKKLPDDLVVKIVDAAQNKYMDDFNKQFDKTKSVSQQKNSSESSSHESTKQDYSVKVDSVDVPDVGSDSGDIPEFNIDIM